MPRKTVHLADPMRRRIGEAVVEMRAFHIDQAQRCERDAAGLTGRYRSEMRRLRDQLRYHARAAADHRDIAEALR